MILSKVTARLPEGAEVWFNGDGGAIGVRRTGSLEDYVVVHSGHPYYSVTTYQADTAVFCELIPVDGTYDLVEELVNTITARLTRT
jgi:hypothetical protein